MKKLLSAVLSLSIVFSSVSPSLAQMAPTAGRQLVKGVVRGGEKAVSPSAARQTLTNAFRHRCAVRRLSSGALRCGRRQRRLRHSPRRSVPPLYRPNKWRRYLPR